MNRREETKTAAAVAASVIIGVSGAGLLGACAQIWDRGGTRPTLRSTIAFVSTRHNLAVDTVVNPQQALLFAEIYLMNGDGTNPRRLTENTYYDAFPALSPDGTRIVFDSNRRRVEGEPFNTTDLFVMNSDGTGQTPLVRGASATWSPDGETIARDRPGWDRKAAAPDQQHRGRAGSRLVTRRQTHCVFLPEGRAGLRDLRHECGRHGTGAAHQQ